MVYQFGYDYSKIRNDDHYLKVFPYNSENKKMATVYQDDKGRLLVFLKGAPELILPFCTKFINKNEVKQKLTTNFIKNI